MIKNTAGNTYEGIKFNSLELVQKLHTTLEPKNILSNYLSFLRLYISIDGLEFQSAHQADLFINLGGNHNIQYTYGLTLDTRDIGEIHFLRCNEFSSTELTFLEDTLCYLIQPLNNAHIHLSALHAANVDPLTGLLNRSLLKKSIQKSFKLADRNETPLSLLILDIDNFKSINDSYGHLVGDEVLIRTAEIVQQSIRETDDTFRIGGEEFLILPGDCTIKSSKMIAERIRKNIKACRLIVNNKPIKFTLSIGLSEYKIGDSIEGFIARADLAMYKAKMSGKNKVMLATEQ